MAPSATWGTDWGGGSAASGGPLGPFVAAIERGHGGRVRASEWQPPEGEFALCLGSDVAGRRGMFKAGDSIVAEQSGDFDATELLRARIAWRGPSQLPVIVEVTSATTSDYTITVNGTSYTHSADTTGIIIGTGFAGSIVAPPEPWLSLGYLSVDDMAGIPEYTVTNGGHRLGIGGAANPNNNGVHPVGISGQGYIDSTQVVWRNPVGTAGDANNGSLTWQMRRIPDDVTRIACNLARIINEAPEAIRARAFDNGTLAIERDDIDDPLVVTTTGNLSAYSVAWRASLEIDTVKHWQDVLEAKRARDLFDVAALIVPLAGGSHDLTFKLALECSAAGRFELEVPALYIDALAFAEGV